MSLGSSPITIVSYNILHGKGMDGKIDLERIAAVIAKESPDLVTLQEVDQNCARSGNNDQAAELGRLLKMNHRFGKFMNLQGGEYGMAVLSRFPIEKTIRHQLPPGAEPRCALEIQVRPDGWQEPLSLIRHKDLLLFSNPHHRSKRTNITVRASLDDGKTWPHYLLLDSAGAGYGYSSLTIIDDETIGILYESSQADMTFQRIKLSDLLKK